MAAAVATTFTQWAGWLVDSYATSVSPSLATDTSFRRSGDDDSFSDEPLSHEDTKSSMQVSSAYGPYVKTGRGGAGNHHWDCQIHIAPRADSPTDLEANRPRQPQRSLADRRKAAARLETIDTSDTMRLRQSSVQYLSAGRGGAGNHIRGDKLAQRSPSLPASFISPITSTPTSPRHNPSFSAIQSGRGGAGNQGAAIEAAMRAETKKQHEERVAAEERHELVVEEVDGILQPPPGAWLGGKRQSEAAFEDCS